MMTSVNDQVCSCHEATSRADQEYTSASILLWLTEPAEHITITKLVLSLRG